MLNPQAQEFRPFGLPAAVSTPPRLAEPQPIFPLFEGFQTGSINITSSRKQHTQHRLPEAPAESFTFAQPASFEQPLLELDESELFECCTAIRCEKPAQRTSGGAPSPLTAALSASAATPAAAAALQLDKYEAARPVSVADATPASEGDGDSNGGSESAAAPPAPAAALAPFPPLPPAAAAAKALGFGSASLLHAELRSTAPPAAVEAVAAATLEQPTSASLDISSCGVALVVPVGSIVAEVASGLPTLSRITPLDFDVLRMVGQGAFGKVFQVRYKGDGQVYAMKVMRKDRIVQKEHSEYVRSERDVLTAVTHPYIVALRFSFQTPEKLYLVLDFVNGGHLFFNLYKQGVFSEEVARLYTAEIVCAISYLHGAGIVHRDLKPENVLLDCDGHVKITDFGLAKGNFHTENDRSNSFIGTVEYMAPEIIQAKGHNKGVDWWSTGILLFEMLCGMPPFRAKSKATLQTQIVSGKVKYPPFLSANAQSLLKGLLTRDVSKRLGSGPGGSDAVKKHPFFKSINWARLERREVVSVFKPPVTNSMDIANFDKLWTDQKAEDSPCGTPTTVAALAQHAHLFTGFSYVSPAFLVQSVERMHLRAAATAADGGGAGVAGSSPARLSICCSPSALDVAAGGPFAPGSVGAALLAAAVLPACVPVASA